MTYFVIAVYVFGDCVKRYVETTREAAELAVQAIKYYADDDRTKHAALWQEAGGVFIHHVNTSDTIQVLNAFGY